MLYLDSEYSSLIQNKKLKHLCAIKKHHHVAASIGHKLKDDAAHGEEEGEMGPQQDLQGDLQGRSFDHR